MTCDTCKTGEVRMIRVQRFSPRLVVVGHVLWILALVAALATGWYQYTSRSAAGTIDLAKENAVSKLRQIDSVTPAMISDFEDDGEISETELSRLGPDDRAEVEKILSDYRTGAFDTGGAGTGAAGWMLYVAVYVLCGAVLIIGVALTLRKELLRCSNCGATVEV
jgi:hypothetical protein